MQHGRTLKWATDSSEVFEATHKNINSSNNWTQHRTQMRSLLSEGHQFRAP
jgi:hypothetical protein